jgi:pimeloyl-ACP methyl ester carboxylesterase
MPRRDAFRVRLVAALLLATLVVATPSGLSAQVESRPESAIGQDGWPLRFTYYPALEKLAGNQNVDLTKAPVVILLHGSEGDRTFWDKTSAPPGAGGKPFAEVLQQQGYAVISLDQRKHGESTREGQERVLPGDYEARVYDLTSIKSFLFEEHQAKRLNMRKLAIIALDESAPIAAMFTELDWAQKPYDDHAIFAERTPRGQDVQALVLVSPQATAGRVQASKALRIVANPAFGIAFMVAVGKKDTAGAKIASTLFKQVGSKANEERTKLEEFDTNEKSQHLFGNPRVRIEVPILQFLNKHVKDRDIPWRDRRSRTERE